MYDKYSHIHGPNSKQAVTHFKQICKKLRPFINSLKDTTLIITADHGFAEAKTLIHLKDHPELKETLVMPFSGDSRVKYCYVKPDKTKQFENYVRTHLSKYCWMYKSKDLVKKNFFGLFEPNPKLFDRIGDYTLIMKDNVVFHDTLGGRKGKFGKGNHSGVSKEEMYVPMIVYNA